MESDNAQPPLSSEPSATESLPVLRLNELGKAPREWTLTLHPTHLALADSPGTQPYIVLRAQMMKSATLMEGARAFALQQPRKVTFQMSAADTARLAEWIGKPVLAAHYLRMRYAWVLPIAIIWILGALPMRGDPAAGVEPAPMDIVGLVLGVVLAGSWALAKWRPHPGLFLVDSLWFFSMACYLVWDVIHGWSKAWLVLVLLLLWMVSMGLKHFARFRGTTLTALRK